MALRTIVQDGDPILKKKCRPVTNYDARLAQLLDDMRDTLQDAQGYGLAAPQVGVMRRVFISVDERDLPENGERPEGYETKFLEFVNPEIIAQEGDVLQYEGVPLVSGAQRGHPPPGQGDGVRVRPRRQPLHAGGRGHAGALHLP